MKYLLLALVFVCSSCKKDKKYCWQCRQHISGAQATKDKPGELSAQPVKDIDVKYCDRTTIEMELEQARFSQIDTSEDVDYWYYNRREMHCRQIN